MRQAKQRLLAREKELLTDIARLEDEARVSGRPEVGDSIDGAATSDARSEFFQETTLEWQTLTQVREALRRIENGTYGRCIDCGRPIEHARLEAIPWAPHCLDDQERRDKAAPARVGSTL